LYSLVVAVVLVGIVDWKLDVAAESVHVATQLENEDEDPLGCYSCDYSDNTNVCVTLWEVWVAVVV
jgi:hypothetical protein